jgi:hypothetical protein
MKINIPYKLFNDFEDLNFMSFILDKNGSSVYRLDLLPSTHPDFFQKTQKDIIAPEKEYKECDTIIMFPNYKTSGWGDKVIMRKGSRRFMPFRKAFTFIKNEKIGGNIEKLKTHLYQGANIKQDTTVVGSKNLIYFTCFGSKKYIRLFELLLQGLSKQGYQNFDILLIADKKTAEEVKKIKIIKKYTVDYFILPHTKDPVKASMRKLKIYDYKNIDLYKNILFLDLDILVIGNHSKVFEERTVPNVFYGSTEKFCHGMHKMVFYRLVEYSNNELERFVKNDTFTFNAGQFFFRNTPTMRKHFNNLNKLIDEWEGEYFFEQGFLNCYFNVLGLSNVFKFKEQFRFVCINKNETKITFNSEAVFVHFMGSTANASDKLFFIKKYYKHLL